jgi:hypothetical protein
MKKYIGIKLITAEPQDKDGQPGYKVVYADGYVSWSPKAVFEAAYISDQEMNFGFALEATKLGLCVMRNSWAENKIVTGYIKFNSTCLVYIFPGDNTTPVGWSPTLNDMYANDWKVVKVD